MIQTLHRHNIHEYATILADIHASVFPDSWSATSIKALFEMDSTAGRIETHRGFILWREILSEIEILTLAVRPKYHRQGIAKQLLTEMLQALAVLQNNVIFLEVAVDNAAAIALYSSFGFKEISRRKDYYRTATGSTDAIIMRVTHGV